MIDWMGAGVFWGFWGSNPDSFGMTIPSNPFLISIDAEPDLSMILTGSSITDEFIHIWVQSRFCKVILFQFGVKWDGAVQGSTAPDGRIQPLKTIFAYPGGNLGAHAACQAVFMKD